MGLGCSGFLAKLILFLINFAVFACGGVLLGVGVYLIVEDEGIGWITEITGGADMNDALFKAAVYLMAGIGAVLFVIGFFGCCGAWKENTCMLSTYACLVSIFLIVQICAGILAAVFSSEIDSALGDSMQESATDKYGGGGDGLLDKAWDDMQMKWKCCGGLGYEDYFNNTHLQQQNLTIPNSCCKEAEKHDDNVEISPEDEFQCQNASLSADDSYFYSDGCYYSFKEWVDQNTKIIMGTFFGLAALQLIGVIFACCVKGKISNSNRVT